jgi:aquaporin Z
VTVALPQSRRSDERRVESRRLFAELFGTFLLVLAGLWSSPISGASMNQARSLAPDLALGQLGHLWLYVVGPLAGAAIAVAFA